MRQDKSPAIDEIRRFPLHIIQFDGKIGNGVFCAAIPYDTMQPPLYQAVCRRRHIMEHYENLVMDEERALYGLHGAQIVHCTFDGPADGESAGTLA